MSKKDFTNPDFIFDYSSPYNYSPYLDFKDEKSLNNYKSIYTYRNYSIVHEEKDIPEGLASKWFRMIVAGLCFSVVIATLPISAFFCVKKISSLQRLVILRLGRLQPIKGPGIAMVLPGVDKYYIVDLGPKKLEMEINQIMMSDNGIVSLGVNVSYRICNVICYVTKTRKVEDTISSLIQHSLVNKVSGLTHDELDRDRLPQQLKTDLNATVTSWGLEISQITIPSVSILKPPEKSDPLTPILNHIGNMFTNAQQCNGAAPVQPVEEPLNEIPEQIDSPLKHQIQTWLTSLLKDKPNSVQFKATYNLDITGPQKSSFCITLDNGILNVESGSKDKADVIMAMEANTLTKILNEEVSAKQAYLSGKVAVSGDWSLLLI